MEEYSDGTHPTVNRMAFLSDIKYTEADKMIDDLREGKEGIVHIWSNQSRESTDYKE